MSETKPKKMVSRNVAVALGIICMVLVVSLAGTIIFLNNLNNSVSDSLNSQITALQNQINDLNDNVNLNKSYTVIKDDNMTNPYSKYSIGPDRGYTFGFDAFYSGYIRVDVQPYDPHLSVHVYWTYNFVTGGRMFSYDFESKYGELGFNGTGYYPIVAHELDYLNPTTVRVDVINNSPSLNISANVTITDYY